ncbi:MAG: nucleotide exchange factor GrpE [Pseudomonadales bacterium]|nr:nucleotide exchange factor GrpE [Pseudomonadales bacterium]
MPKSEDQNSTENGAEKTTSDAESPLEGELLDAEQEASDAEVLESAKVDSEVDAESVAQAGDTPIDGSANIAELQAALEKASVDVANYKDMALRAEAEMQNVRRRASKDLEKAHKFGIEKLLQNILPVVDSLEKAVESAQQSADENNKAIVEGVGLCQKMLVDILIKEGVEVIDPMGEPFDPNVHQAMSMVENPEVEPNSVIAVIQKGYSLKGRLIRPAMVMVSKSSPKIDETA